MICRSVPSARIWLVALGLFAAIPVHQQDGTAAPRFSEWSAPVNLGAVINTAFGEFAAHTSKDELTLYFASDRPNGSFGGEDLWISQRASTDAPWAAPLNLGAIVNTASNERSPALSRDGHYLFFASDRPGGLGGLDIWMSWRGHTRDDFGWEAPVNLGAAVNTASTDAGPSFFENDDGGVPHLLLASNRAGGSGGLDLYVSRLLDGLFQPPAPIQELNTPQNDLTPGIRFDGLEVVFASNRPNGVGGNDLWTAARNSVGHPWSAPTNLDAPINSTSGENFPTISADRRSLYFDSGRAGGFGGGDLYVSTRGR